MGRWRAVLCWLLQIPLGFPDSSVGKESACNAGDPGLIPGLGRSAGEGRDRLPTPVFLGFPCGSAGKEITCNAGDLGSIPGLGRPPAEGKSHPLQYSGLKNSLDCRVHGVAKSWTRLSDFLFHFLSRSHQQRAVLGGLGRNPQCWESWHEAPRTSLSFHIDWKVSTTDESGTSVMSLD